MKRVTTPLLNKYIPLTPHPKQQFFLLLNHIPEVFYGGSAGPGKSTALLMSALQFVDKPEYNALILRRTFSDLNQAGALMDQSKSWLYGSDAKWNENTHRWTFPSGARLTFGHLESSNAHFNYQGPGYHYIAIDELTQVPEYQYQFLFSRIRRLKDSSIPIRFRSASNPGGPYHSWVKRRFVDAHDDPGRFYVKATFLDNPSLDVDEYRKALSRLSPLDRKRYEEGDWDVSVSGNKFRREWFRFVDSKPEGVRWLRYWDMASTPVDESDPSSDPDWTAGCLVGQKDGVYFIGDLVRLRGTPGEVERVITNTANRDGKSVHVWMEQEPGSSGVTVIDHYRRRVLQGWSFRGDRVTGSKEDYADPIASQAEAGNVVLCRGAWNEALLDELEAFPTAGVHDDQVDAFVKGCHKTNIGGFRVW